jgi:predicted nucleic acid-binding protein
MTVASKDTRCFIDSNIWIYAATESTETPPDPRHTMARELITQVQPCLSVQVVNEVTSNLMRKFKFSEPEIRNFIQSIYSQYTVFGLDGETLIQGSTLRESYKISFWDSLVISSALQNKCTILYTEDMQHGLVVNGTLTITNPFRK